MRVMRRLLCRLFASLTRNDGAQRVESEIEEHLALQTAENIRAGLDFVEARRQAVLKFGSLESVKESYRDGNGLPLLEVLLRDARQAIRRLRKAPVFSITTILMVAVGIGATTTIFSLV